MTTRLRPCFSLRTLAIVVTLACLYFGAWEATKRWGLPKIVKLDRENTVVMIASSPAACVIWRVEGDENNPNAGLTKCYYLWLFGPSIELPYNSKW